MVKKGQGKLLSAISRLKALERHWPDGYYLYAASGSLYLVRNDNQRIVADLAIPCDGGDPGYRSEGGSEYLDI